MNTEQQEPAAVGMMMDMMMPMHFWSGYTENSLTWLFRDVTSDSTGDYIGGLILVFFFGILIEGVTYLRNFVYIRS